MRSFFEKTLGKNHAIKRRVKIIMWVFVLIFSLSLIVGLEGCCFDPGTGFCSQNTESVDCVSPGEWTSNPTCSVNKCELGCCLLGESSQYVTSRTCELLSSSYGFEFPGNFQYTDEQTCQDLGRSQEYGACLYLGEYDNDCRYVTYSQCPTGNFESGIYCSNASVETICNQTQQTTCFQDSAHYLDSCGNIDELKEECDYENGTMCKLDDGAHKCIDLNCGEVKGVNRSNGEEWCDFEGEEYFDLNTIYGENGRAPTSLGSRFLKKYCLNGEVYTEPCSDFRMEFCEQGKCEINPWQECLVANSEEPDPATGSTLNKEDCNAMEYCGVLRVDDCVEITSSAYAHSLGKVCGEARDNWRGTYADRVAASGRGDASNIDATEVSSGFLSDLNLEMCSPRVPGGFEFYPRQGNYYNVQQTTCALANVNKLTKFDHDKGPGDGSWFVKNIGATSIVNTAVNKYGNFGLYYLSEGYSLFGGPFVSSVGGEGTVGGYFWISSAMKPIFNAFGSTEGSSRVITALYQYQASGKIPPFKTVNALNLRCASLGDCSGSANWLGESGGSTSIKQYSCTQSTVEQFKCTFDFSCNAAKAPEGGDNCGECGKDDLPCTEYRCKSLGRRCEYSEPRGADRGFCVTSSDNRAAAITAEVNPTSPIQPFTPVEIKVITDEIAYCKFNLGNAEGNYDSMLYDLGTNWSTEHFVRLNLPGQIPNNAGISEYNLIQRDGQYEMYVRCVDGADNWNINPYLIRFEVMQTPDKIPPIIYLNSFEPYSGSAAAYLETSKEIKFQIDFPAECKWSNQDKGFDLMENEFVCDEQISDIGAREGYFCIGELNNITNNSQITSNYYIRCKDQPWLDIKNVDETLYQRNVNTESVIYNLRASDELKILEIGPRGDITITSQTNLVNLGVVTIGGGFNGIAECKWKLSGGCVENANIAYTEFAETNARTHRSSKANLSEGDCRLFVKCQDSAMNFVNGSTNFKIQEDNRAPKVIRAYHFGGELIVLTDEKATCKITTDPRLNCGFEWNHANVSLMSGTELSHSTSWNQGKKHYIKCKDYRDNVNRGCAIIVNTY
jgi:hypothetical protein